MHRFCLNECTLSVIQPDPVCCNQLLCTLLSPQYKHCSGSSASGPVYCCHYSLTRHCYHGCRNCTQNWFGAGNFEDHLEKSRNICNKILFKLCHDYAYSGSCYDCYNQLCMWMINDSLIENSSCPRVD